MAGQARNPPHDRVLLTPEERRTFEHLQASFAGSRPDVSCTSPRLVVLQPRWMLGLRWLISIGALVLVVGLFASAIAAWIGLALVSLGLVGLGLAVRRSSARARQLRDAMRRPNDRCTVSQPYRDRTWNSRFWQWWGR